MSAHSARAEPNGAAPQLLLKIAERQWHCFCVSATLQVLRPLQLERSSRKRGGIVFIAANGGGQGVRLRHPEDEPAGS